MLIFRLLIVPIQNFLDVTPANQSVDLQTEATFLCSNPGLEPNDFFWIRNNSNPTSVPDATLIGKKTKFTELNNYTSYTVLTMFYSLLIDLTMPDNNPYIIVNGPLLVISEAGLDDAGVYACVSNVSEVTVVEPAVLSITPNITNTLMEMFVEEGDRVEFPCMATGFPTPTYHWEKRNELTGMFEEIPNENNTVLVFDSVGFNDFGRYRCVATVAFLETITDESNDVLLHG